MAKTIGKNRNTTDDADMQGATTVDDATTTLLLSGNEDRIVYSVYVETGDIWIKEQADTVDNLKEGVTKVRCGELWIPPDKVEYTGPVSAISVDGNATVHATEW